VTDDTKRAADALMARMSVLTLAGIALDRTASQLTRLAAAYKSVVAASLATIAIETQKRVTEQTKADAKAHSDLLARGRRKSFRAI
jgi:hypothetical protein